MFFLRSSTATKIREVSYLLGLSLRFGIRQVLSSYLRARDGAANSAEEERLLEEIVNEAVLRANKNGEALSLAKSTDKAFLTSLSKFVSSSQQYRWASTSGSSGKPFKFKKSSTSFLNSQFSYWFFFKRLGLSRFDFKVYIGGARQTNQSRWAKVGGKAYAFLFGEKKFVSSDINSEEELRLVYNFISVKRPKVIAGFGSGLLKLAAFMKRSNLKFPYRPALVHPSAETVTKAQITMLQDCFEPDLIAMVYGSTEGHFASQCSEGTYHVESSNCIVANSSEGLLVTIFGNYQTPFYRYAIGDYGEVSDTNSCPCGRKGQTIDKLRGRTSDYIEASGVRLHHADINMLVQSAISDSTISSYQLQGSEEGGILLRADGLYSERQILLALLTDRYPIDVKLVDEPPLIDASGKIRPILNNLAVSMIPKQHVGYRPYAEVSSGSGAQARFKLDWNEGFANTDRLIAAFQQDIRINLYPDLHCSALRDAATKFYGVQSDQILAFNGSDSAISTIFQTFIDNEGTVQIFVPTYGNYKAIASKYTSDIVESVIDPQCDNSYAATIFDNVSDVRPNLAVIVNPNNPTGQVLSLEEVVNVVDSFPSTLFIIDQAYAEFSTNGEHNVSTLLEHQNVIVLRTLSKAFSLAGARLGFSMATKTLSASIARMRDNKQVNSFSQQLGTYALSNPEYMWEFVAEVEGTKFNLKNFLNENAIQYICGEGNFILVKVSLPGVFVAALAEEGIYIRDRSNLPLLNGYVRITIPAAEHLEELKSAIVKALDVVKKTGLYN